MCYKYATPTLDELLAHLASAPSYDIRDYAQYYYADGFAHPFMAVTTNEEPTVIQPAMWGLVPGWAKSLEQAKDMAAKCLNAVSEKIFETASFKNHILKQRCLIWVKGFYEWQWRDKGKNKIPHFIYMKDRQPLTFGGVYTKWVHPDTGELITTFSIITTEANALMAEVHNNKKRMPLVILPQDREKWLSNLTKDEVTVMMQPLADGLLDCHTISKLITGRDERNVPEVQEPFNYENSLF